MTWPRTPLPWWAPESVAEREAEALACSYEDTWDKMGRAFRALASWCDAKLARLAAVPSWNGAKVED